MTLLTANTTFMFFNFMSALFFNFRALNRVAFCCKKVIGFR